MINHPSRAKVEAGKANWRKSHYRATIEAAQKTRFADPKVRALHGARTKAGLADPSIRSKMSVAIRAALSRPATKAKQTVRMRIRNSDDHPMAGIDERSGSFRARIKHRQRNITLGSFETLEAAQEARRAGERKYWGEL